MTLSEFNELKRKAETGEQWAEICRIELAGEVETHICGRCGQEVPEGASEGCRDPFCAA